MCFRNCFQKRQAGSEMCAGWQPAFVGDDRYIVLGIDLDVVGSSQASVAGHVILPLEPRPSLVSIPLPGDDLGL